MPLLTVSGLRKLYGPDVILEGTAFALERGEHVALVGSNGSGKSTLLRIIDGSEPYDAGQITLARNAIVTYVSQHAEFETDHTLWDAMLETFKAARDAQEKMRALEREMGEGSSLELDAEYRRLSAIAEHPGYDYESRIERVLTGLELGQADWQKPVSQLSGGQKTRANLARALLNESDLLLLDEPTNHLDIAAMEWLEKYLSSRPQAYIVVAHDRYFLERVSKRTLQLSNGRIEDYPAGYVGFLRLRAERRARETVEYERQQEHIEKTEEFVRRFGAGQRSKEAKGRQKQLDRLERLDRPVDERTLKIRLEKGNRKGDAALRLEGLAAGYDRVLVQGPEELVVRHGARVAIVGPNGAGKTTLARTLIGELEPLAGRLTWAPGSQPAYYAQTTTTEFPQHATVMAAFQERFPVGEEAVRAFLGRFLFSGDEVSKRVGDLSGGEQSRLALGVMLYAHPNAMLLDEPTNHLDIAAREALEDALSGFGGTLILISHDRFLIERLATEVWAIEEGRLAVYDGTWSDYAAGRYRRNLRYAELESRTVLQPADHQPVSAAPGHRDPAVISRSLMEAQESLAASARRGEAGAATASVDGLGEAVQQYEAGLESVSSLTAELIEALSR